MLKIVPVCVSLLCSCFMFAVSGVALGAEVYQPTDVVNPVGDESLGALEVLPPSVKVSPFALVFAGTPFKPGETLRVKEQIGVLKLENKANSQYSSSVEVQIVKTKTSQVQLAALNLIWDTDVLLTQIGPKAHLLIKGTETGFTYSQLGSEKWRHGFIPLLPDTLNVNIPELPMISAQKILVGQGQVLNYDFKFSDVRAAIEIIPAKAIYPDGQSAIPNCSRETPDLFVAWRTQPLSNASTHIPFPIYTAGGWDSSGTGFLKEAFSGRTKDHPRISFFPSVDGKVDLTYELVVNNLWVPIQAKAGETVSFQLKRLDINHVNVTREDGTTYLVPGKYKVYSQVKNSATGAVTWTPVEAPVQCSTLNKYSEFPTQTGLTVFPGIYKVVVNYNTEEGMKQTEVLVDLN